MAPSLLKQKQAAGALLLQINGHAALVGSGSLGAVHDGDCTEA
jgi:hypothetical protein